MSHMIKKKNKTVKSYKYCTMSYCYSDPFVLQSRYKLLPRSYDDSYFQNSRVTSCVETHQGLLERKIKFFHLWNSKKNTRKCPVCQVIFQKLKKEKDEENSKSKASFPVASVANKYLELNS